MRFPRVSLSLPRLTFPAIGSLISRNALLYGAFTVALFLIFMVVNFPHDVVVRRAVSQLDIAPFEFDFGSARFAWHRGYELNGVRLTNSTLADGTLPLMEVATIDVLPQLAGLIRGELTGMSLHAALYGGAADGTWSVTNAGGTGELKLHGLELGRYRLLTAQLDEGQLAGQVSGTITMQLTGGRKGAQAAGELIVNRPGLSGGKVQGFTVPDLQFAQIKAKFALKGDRLDLQEFHATGDQLAVNMTGNIALRTPIDSSTLNLKVTLEESPATPPAIKAMIALIPRPKNARADAPVTIAGTFAAPQIR